MFELLMVVIILVTVWSTYRAPDQAPHRYVQKTGDLPPQKLYGGRWRVAAWYSEPEVIIWVRSTDH